MTTEPAPELALAAICGELVQLGRRFALVGGLAVSARAEVRFTRDVDLVVLVADDAEAESLTYHLRSAGYTAVASVGLQDRIDAQRLLQFTPALDVERVREHLARITARGYAREQDLEAKLALVLRDVGNPSQ